MTTINNAVNQPTIQTVQPKKAEQPKDTKKGISTTTKVVVGTGLAALAAVGMYMLTKGKGVKPPVGVKPTIPENLSHLDVDLFKQLGKFDKGKATLAGKEFTGKIFTRNGCELTYSKGILQSSKSARATKTYHNGKLRVINHNYTNVGGIKQTVVDRMSDGTRVITKRRGGYDGRFMDADKYGNYIEGAMNHDIVTTIKPNGEVTRLSRNLENYKTKMQPYAYDKLEHLNNGKIEVTKKGLLPKYDSTKIKQHKMVDGKKVTEELNEKGEVIRSWVTEFNPKNKVSSQIITENGSQTTLFRDKQGNVLKKAGDGKNAFYSFWNENSKEFGQFSTKNPYNHGVSKEKIQEYIQKNGLPFEV